jgi:UDP-GlcNAc:undecaprenyl-phosphate GlcNAc-1-phosphate transferase
MPELIIVTALGAGLAFGVTFCLTTILARHAYRFGLVDMPRGRKDHAAPTPVVGGVAIFFGALAGLAPPAMALWHLPPHLLGFALAAIIVVVSGVLDDAFDVRWYLRLAAQAAAALLIVEVGDVRVEHLGPLFGLEDLKLGALSTPVTVIATVGVINALNMIDGVDGLAGSLSAAALFMLFGAALYSGNIILACGLAVAIAAVLAFLCLNLRSPWQKQARVFMGNSGSALLGLLIAWALFRLTQSPEHPVTPILGAYFVAVPVIDCFAVIVRRLSRGMSPVHADREHVHHLLLDAGLRPSTIVLFLSLMAMIIGVGGSLAFRAGVEEPVLVLAFLLLGGWYAWFTNSRQRIGALVARLGGPPVAAVGLAE